MTTITVYDNDGAIIELSTVPNSVAEDEANYYRYLYQFPDGAFEHEGMRLTMERRF